jgi:excinuclease ABC subunit A
MDLIRVRGARTHNLRGIDVDLPRERLVVITGLSGSGKSSLAFDTLYAEGQRRYVESLSAYARQFLPIMDRPEVDRIDGLSPAIAIEQRRAGANPRSTVGTVTEIHDHLRLLYARAGRAHCPDHPGKPLAAHSVARMVDFALALPPGRALHVLAPLVQGERGAFDGLLHDLQSRGFVRFRIDGAVHEAGSVPRLDPQRTHHIEAVIDRLRAQDSARSRLADSIETALRVADGRMVLLEPESGTETAFSIRPTCPLCGYAAPLLEPRLFSFNSPHGACPACAGLGRVGPGGAGGETQGAEAGPTVVCPECRGTRLRREARYVFLEEGGRSYAIFDVEALALDRAAALVGALELDGARLAVAQPIVAEIESRLRFLNEIGLAYLSLERSADSLSGGEAQRIRLASQIGAGLTGVTYVLDEPSIGLHARDNERLIGTLRRLTALGNSVLVVEHDEDMMRAADHIVDMGPGAGEHGGRVVAQGTPAQIMADERSLTGDYLAGRRRIEVPRARARPGAAWLRVRGASGHNLREIDLELPVGCLTCVTGVSGSGKSTLVNDTLARAAARHLHGAREEPQAHQAVEGLEQFDRVVRIDQAPIGRTPRSNPATYAGLFSDIRELFAATATARERGYGAGRFSFNVAGGRCEECQGDGLIKVQMHFLPDVYVTCESCGGRRYNRETLEVLFKGRNIAEILDLSVEQARPVFDAIPALQRRLRTLSEVGLDYLRLGQSATTLSGGEAQRVKLALELSRRETGRTLYVLDEPTTGLHFHDIALLLRVLHRLRDAGNTIVIIEHNLDVARNADWIVDLGPEGGSGGGAIVDAGTPEQVAARARGPTGRCLASRQAPPADLPGRRAAAAG